MKSRTEQIEKCYTVEYALQQGIHAREGEILHLKHTNSKQVREIGSLMDHLVEKEEIINDLKGDRYNVSTTLSGRIYDLECELKGRNEGEAKTLAEKDLSIANLLFRIDNLKITHSGEIETLYNRINELEFELEIRNVPMLRESLKKGARLALAQSDEIDRLNARIDKILETTPDDQINDYRRMFEHLKTLLIELSHKEGNDTINPDDIDIKYIEAASRYCFPVLFDKYAIFGKGDLMKIGLADSILDAFGIDTMDDYQNSILSNDIDLKYIDMRKERGVRSSAEGSEKQDKVISQSGKVIVRLRKKVA